MRCALPSDECVHANVCVWARVCLYMYSQMRVNLNGMYIFVSVHFGSIGDREKYFKKSEKYE